MSAPRIVDRALMRFIGTNDDPRPDVWLVYRGPNGPIWHAVGPTHGNYACGSQREAFEYAHEAASQHRWAATLVPGWFQ